MHALLRYTNPTAMVIGYVVMFAWLLAIAWGISTVIGEFRFNRLLKQRREREFDRVRSDWLSDTREPEADRHDTDIIDPIIFKFHRTEDFLATEETAAVFDIRERYPNEFA